MIWIGIDEAGYGPNLGPLVMAAVVATDESEATTDRCRKAPTIEADRPDVWGVPSGLITRAGGPPEALWVDDSKKVYAGKHGRDRLEATTAWLLGRCTEHAPDRIDGFLDHLGSGLEAAELGRWLTGDADGCREPIRFPTAEAVRFLEARPRWSDALDGAGWQILDVRAIVLGPESFNARLDGSPTHSKATVHASVFAELVREVHRAHGHLAPMHLLGDKHGGRNTYLPLLTDCFPDAWIDRGREGREASDYSVRTGDHPLHVSFRPRADAGDGLVALASILAKSLRERWMCHFNAYWQRLVPALKPCAGYPVDARRFLADLEAAGVAGTEPRTTWWRVK